MTQECSLRVCLRCSGLPPGPTTSVRREQDTTGMLPRPGPCGPPREGPLAGPAAGLAWIQPRTMFVCFVPHTAAVTQSWIRTAAAVPRRVFRTFSSARDRDCSTSGSEISDFRSDRAAFGPGRASDVPVRTVRLRVGGAVYSRCVTVTVRALSLQDRPGLTGRLQPVWLPVGSLAGRRSRGCDQLRP